MLPRTNLFRILVITLVGDRPFAPWVSCACTCFVFSLVLLACSSPHACCLGSSIRFQNAGGSCPIRRGSGRIPLGFLVDFFGCAGCWLGVTSWLPEMVLVVISWLLRWRFVLLIVPSPVVLLSSPAASQSNSESQIGILGRFSFRVVCIFPLLMHWL